MKTFKEFMHESSLSSIKSKSDNGGMATMSSVASSLASCDLISCWTVIMLFALYTYYNDETALMDG